jgi:hypothetical protein
MVILAAPIRKAHSHNTVLRCDDFDLTAMPAMAPARRVDKEIAPPLALPGTLLEGIQI